MARNLTGIPTPPVLRCEAVVQVENGRTERRVVSHPGETHDLTAGFVVDLGARELHGPIPESVFLPVLDPLAKSLPLNYLGWCGCVVLGVGEQRVVPLSMELVASDLMLLKGFHLFVGDLDAFGVGVGV